MAAKNDLSTELGEAVGKELQDRFSVRHDRGIEIVPIELDRRQFLSGRQKRQQESNRSRSRARAEISDPDRARLAAVSDGRVDRAGVQPVERHELRGLERKEVKQVSRPELGMLKVIRRPPGSILDED